MEAKQLVKMLQQDHPLAVVKEEPPEEESEIFDFCYETVTKEELILEDEVDSVDNQPVSKRKRIEPEQAVEKRSKKGQQTDEAGSSFCYETVTKEELIIEDDALGVSAEHAQKDVSLPDNSASNQFKCDVCQKVCVDKRNLGKHKKLHEKCLKKIQCPDCDETFDDKYSFLIHSKIHIERVKPQYEELLEQDKGSYTCLLCDKSNMNRNIALGHVQEHMSLINGNFQCKICGMRYSRNHLLEKHMARGHKNSSDQLEEGVYKDYEPTSNAICEDSETPLHCQTCDVFFNNRTNLNIHLWKSKLKIVQLKIAAEGKKLSEKKINPIPYNNLKLEADKDGFYNCSKCDYQIDQQRAFKRHLRGHKAVELGVHTCDVCQMRFPSKGYLDNHKKIHTENFGFECQTCLEKFRNRSELTSHRYRAHPKSERVKQFMEQVPEDEKGVFTCPFCGKADTNRTSAYQHFCGHVSDTFVCKIERMGDEKKQIFPCSICSEKFDTKTAYQRHRNSHNSNLKVFLGLDDVYHCTRCDETFPKINLAYKHFNTHGPIEQGLSKDLPFKCSVCNKTFHLEKARKRCEYNHNIIKLQKFKCKTCGKCFTCKQRLLEHQVTHKKQKQKPRPKKRMQRRKEAEEDEESTDSTLRNEDDEDDDK